MYQFTPQRNQFTITTMSTKRAVELDHVLSYSTCLIPYILHQACVYDVERSKASCSTGQGVKTVQGAPGKFAFPCSMKGEVD